MKKRLLSVLLTLSMVLTLLPGTALAAGANETIYSNEETGITIKVTSGNINVEKEINFTVIVDGSTVVEKHNVTVAAATTDLNVDAAGYDVTFKTTNGMTVAPGINNNYNVGLGVPDSYDCTINLASTKTKDDITIGTNETVYGIFSWSKQHAGNSAYSKDIEIYVNDSYAYTQTVNTPRTLSNIVGSNQEFWFTPGEDFNPTYEMDRLVLDSASNQKLRIDLTTKCPCGRDTCLCEGGNCGCEPGCGCPNCMGTNLEDNQINTGYGIIEYMEPGSQGGYRLQVRINLNGTIVYTSKWFRVYMGLPGNLKFTPTAGKYFFQNPNSYDIVTLRSGSTWSEYTGQLSIAGVTQEVRDYDNILTINLVSFDNKVTLDVERRSGAPTSQVIGYRVSYTLEDKEYTYDYYNFAATQAPNIPTNVPVTITAICNSPYEVAQWSTGNAHAGNVTLTGSEGQDGTEAYGNSVTLTVNSAGDTTILLYIDNLGTVTVPDDDDLIDPDTGLLKDNAVTIDCTNEKAQHSDWTYGLKSGTYTIGTLGGNSADGYACDITVTNTVPYVTSYNTDVSDGHTLDPVDQGQKTITLKWVNGEWTVPTGEAPVTYTVKCKTGSDPGTDPDDGEITGITKTVVTQKPSWATDGTYDYPEVKDGENVVTITEDTTSVTLLYAITVTGTPDTQFTVTDEDATLVSPTDGPIKQGTDGEADEFTGEIPTGGTITFYVSKTFTSVNEGDTLTNSASAAVTGGEDDTETDTEEVTVEEDDDGDEPVEPENPGLEITKTLDEVNGKTYTTGNVAVGDELTYTITVTNTGNVALENVVVTDAFTGAGKLNFTSSYNATDNGDGTYTITIGSLPCAEGSNVATITATYEVVKADADKTISNSATATAGDDAEDETGDDSPEVSVVEADILDDPKIFHSVNGSEFETTDARQDKEHLVKTADPEISYQAVLDLSAMELQNTANANQSVSVGPISTTIYQFMTSKPWEKLTSNTCWNLLNHGETTINLYVDFDDQLVVTEEDMQKVEVTSPYFVRIEGQKIERNAEGYWVIPCKAEEDLQSVGADSDDKVVLSGITLRLTETAQNKLSSDKKLTLVSGGYIDGTVTFGGFLNSLNPLTVYGEAENDQVNLALDAWNAGGEDEPGGETGGDGTADYKQALIKYVSAGNGTVSPTVQVETLTAGSDGTYSGSVTASSKATASPDYAFDYWTEPGGTTSWNATLSDTFTARGGQTYTYTAHFDTDANGDGIPDKHQATVTYKIVGGTWSDGSSADIKEVFTLKEKDEDGQWEDKNPTLGDTIPTGMTPDATHVIPGNWDTAINENTPVTENVTYTYIFTTAEPSLIVLKSVSPTSDVGLGDELTYTIKVTNNGNQALTDVTVTDTMWGDEVTSISVDDSTVSVGAAGYTIQNLPVGETVTITYTYTITADDLGKTITNHVTAETEGEDGPEGDDTTTTEVEEGELTVTIQPADITIYTGGRTYGGITDASGNIIEGASGLPEPGYHLELSADVMAWLNEKTGTYGPRDLEDYLTFTYAVGNVTREWELTYVGVYDTNPTRYVYSLEPGKAENGEEIPVRLLFKDETGEVTYDDIIGMTEDAASAEYTMSINPGGLTQSEIKAQFKVGDEEIEATVDIDPGILTIRSVVEEEVSTIQSSQNGVSAGDGITAVDGNDVNYYVNDSEVEVAADRVGLLVDEVSNNNGFDREMAQDAMDHAIDNTSWNRWSDLSYDMAYLDLVDTLNGHAVVTMGEGDSLTIYWPMPNDANRRGDFHVVHYHTMNRESIENDLDDADKEILTGEAVRIDGQWYVQFTTDSFSPFVLVYEAEDDDDDRPRPPRPDDDDDDEDEDDVEEPDETPVDDGLNREDHYAYLAGYTDGTIRPEGNITRAEVATIFFRLMTDEYREDCWSQNSGFTDVSSASWYNNAVSTTAQAGWIAGYEDGSFRPNAYITRAEFATIAARFLSEDYAGGHRFNDIQGHWAAEYIDRAAAAGWIGGYEDGSFRPNAYITRAEVATLVNRMLDRAPDVGHLLANMVRWPDNPETAWYYADIQEATNSHDYTRAGTGNYEVWTELLANRDWAALEEIWSQANDAPGGEVMG